MSTFADKNTTIFRTRSEEDTSRLRRKRSTGRLKGFASTTDNRAWGCIEDERRRHILEYLKSYHPHLGNYIPLDYLFGALFNMGESNSNEMDPRLVDAIKKQQELEGQKHELSALATCLSRAGGDLKKQNACMQSEIDRLKKLLKQCEGDKKNKGDSCIKMERDILRTELDNLRNIEQQWKAAEQRITELMCEVEGLQKCIDKAECDALQMVQIIEQQQAQICRLQMGECKLQDVTTQRDLLKKQLDSCNPSPCDQSDSFGMSDSPDGNCNDNEETNKLKCQVQMIEEELKMKDIEINQLTKKLCKQNECINNLKAMLAGSDKDPCGANVIPVDNSSSETYCKDLEDMQCKMKDLQNKVGQQAQVIMSQRKCLLEQHKYILEQEQVRSNIQCRIKEQARKQAELIYERNLLRNEIVFLTARLKTYLGKIQLLEKSIEQLFDTTKSSNCNGGGILKQMNDPCSRSMCPQPLTGSASAGPLGKGKSPCGQGGLGGNSMNRCKNFQNQFSSNTSGCPDLPESQSSDTFRPFIAPSYSSNDALCPPPCDDKPNKSAFMGGGMSANSNSCISFSADNCNDMFNSGPPMPPCCPPDDQFSSTMGNDQMPPYSNSTTYSSQNSYNYNSRNPPERDSSSFKPCKACF